MFNPFTSGMRAGRFAAVVAMIVATTMAGATLPAQAAAAAPTGLVASGGPIPTLSWDRVASATKYRVQGSADSSYSTLVFNQETTNSRYTPTRVLRAGALYWRVQATDSTGTSPWSTSETAIGAQSAPVGLRISPGQTVLPPVSPPVIAWNPVAGATGYDVEMDADSDGLGSTLKTNIKTTTYVWPDPQGVGEREGVEDFFVRVRAKFDNSLQSDWSEWATYDVAQLPAVTSAECATGLICAPDPVSGVRPSSTVQDVVFDWDPVKGAKEYEIWVALDQDFNTQVEKLRVFSTRYSPATTYDNNNYFWKVRPYNASAQPTPWPATPSQFQRRWPQRPQLLFPTDANLPAVGDDFYFQWSPVRHATEYALEIGSDRNFTPGTYETCRTASTTYTPGHAGDRCMPSQGTAYYWRVRAFDQPKNVAGVYSDQDLSTSEVDPATFVYDSGAVSLLEPANGATVSVPTFAWAPSQDAVSYRIWVDGPTGSVSTTTSALSWTPPSVLPTDSDTEDPARAPDRFTWKVDAKDADGKFSPLYPGRSVYVEESVQAGPSPLTPLPTTNEISSRFPSLSWQPLASSPGDRVYYKLRVSDTPGYVLPESATAILRTKLFYPAVTDISTYFLTPGSRTWWVDAYDAESDAPLGTSQEATFRIEAPSRSTGQQLALDGRAVDAGTTCTKSLVVGDEQTVCTGISSTPVLDWEPTPGAGGYLVYVAEDPDFTQKIYDGLPTFNSRWTPHGGSSPKSLPDNESGPAYYWFVRPCVSVNPAINCGPGPSGATDSGTNAFRKVSPAVRLQAPAEAARFADEVTFSWEDYHLTNQDSAAPHGGATPSHQTARLYRIQVAQSATITDSNVIDDRIVDQATYTAYAKTYPEGDLWWRVQALDAANNRLAWSETRKLVKATPATNLDPHTAPVAPLVERAAVDPRATPAFDSRLPAGSTLFQWTAHDLDATWNLEVYGSDDTTGSEGNLVFKTVTKQAAFATPSSLPPSSAPYRWRIKRTDVTGQPGQWSDFGRFWIDPLPVTLSSPTDGAAVAPNGAAFTWEPYAVGGTQAAKYVIDIDPATGGTNPGAATTSATAWESPSNLVSGTYTWSVKAYDTTGGLVGSSDARTFTVAAGLEAVAPPRIEAPGGSAVGSTLTSVPPTWNQPDVENAYQWLRDGSVIWGAKSDTYVLTVADYTKSITLRVTGAKPAYVNGQSVSNAIGVTAGGALQNTGIPTIAGTAASGSTLRATNGSWAPAASKYRYQWMRNGAPIPNATGSSYRLSPEDAGRAVSVTVFASAPGLNEGGAASSPVTVSKLTSTTTATLAKTRVKPGKRVKIGIAVTVPGVAGPTGQVKVFDGAKKLKKLTLVSTRNGKLSWRLPKLKKGKHKIKVVYLGNASTTKSKSKIAKLFVVR